MLNIQVVRFRGGSRSKTSAKLQALRRARILWSADGRLVGRCHEVAQILRPIGSSRCEQVVATP